MATFPSNEPPGGQAGVPERFASMQGPFSSASTSQDFRGMGPVNSSIRLWEQREAGDCLEVLAVERHEWNVGGDTAGRNPGVVRSNGAAHGLTIGDEPSPNPWDRWS